MGDLTLKDLENAFDSSRTQMPRGDLKAIMKQIDTDQDGHTSELEAKAFIWAIDSYNQFYRPDLIYIKHLLEKRVLEQTSSPSQNLSLSFRYGEFEKMSLSERGESSWAMPSGGGEYTASFQYNIASVQFLRPSVLARLETGPGVYFSAYAPEEMITGEGPYITANLPSNGIDDVGIFQGGQFVFGVAPFGQIGLPLYVTLTTGAQAQLGRVVYSAFKGEEGLPNPAWKIQLMGTADLGLTVPVKIGRTQTLFISGGQEMVRGKLSSLDGATGSVLERGAFYTTLTLQAN